MTKERYTPQQWETVNCTFCDSDKRKLHERYGSELQFSYQECLDCGLIYQSPRPKYDEHFIQAAYGNYYMQTEGFEYSEKDQKAWGKGLKEILKYDQERDSILDIGVGMGSFLNVAKDEYKTCEGVDVSLNMATFTQTNLDIKVHIGQFEKINFDKKFSCIHMSHVIEHIPNPVYWLKKAKEILKDDGVLVICVPNMLSLEKRVKLFFKRLKLRKGIWKDNSRTPDHLFEPTIPSMLWFLETNGFKVINHYTYSKKDMDVSTLWGKIYNRKLKQGTSLRFFCKLG